MTWLVTQHLLCCNIGCQSHLLPGLIGFILFHGSKGLVWISWGGIRIELGTFQVVDWRLGQLEVSHKFLWQFWHIHIRPWRLAVHFIYLWFPVVSFWRRFSYILGIELVCSSKTFTSAVMSFSFVRDNKLLNIVLIVVMSAVCVGTYPG